MAAFSRCSLGHGGWVVYEPGFVPDHRHWMENLRSVLPLRQETLRVWGRDVETPRLTSWHGDAHALYAYSGRCFSPRPWNEGLACIRDQVSRAIATRFNSVLVNYYRDGSDAMGMHADDEQELGPAERDVRIASVSFGARRKFVLRSRDGRDTYQWQLGGGDLLVMGGTTQRFFRHGIRRTKRAVGPRMNLTFRVVGRSSVG